jgi:NADP-dependent 3-hydroxy acid dehydrogenase YdfG
MVETGLKDKVVIVTGGAGGIGLATAAASPWKAAASPHGM